jgi:hypothetical protein
MLEEEVVEKGDENRKQDGRHPVAADECSHQPSSQTDPPIPMSSLVPLFGQFQLFGLEILDDHSFLFPLCMVFLYISHWNLTYR